MNLIIISSCLFALVAMSYLIFKLKDFKHSDLLKDFVDISPAVAALFFPGFKPIVFLMACLIANEFIYDNIFIGAILFAIGYVCASIFAISLPLVIAKVLIATVSSVAIIFPLICMYKGEIKLKIAASIYGLITLPFLFYAFYITWNPGFLALVVGDSLLLVAELFEGNKSIRIVSDLFYFFGTFFVPLSLVGGWL